MLSLQKAWPWSLLSHDLILVWPELMSSFSPHCLGDLKYTCSVRWLQDDTFTQPGTL